MPGGTFSLPKAYAASAVVVADGVIAAATPTLLSSATAAFTALDEGKAITVAGAGPAAADLVTTIKQYISATKVILADAATTAVAAANLTYVIGVYRLRNLVRQGDIAGTVYSILAALRLQLQVNSLSPGKVYVGGPLVSPTNSAIELSSPGSADDENTGRTFDDFVCCDADSSLLNINWQASF